MAESKIIFVSDEDMANDKKFSKSQWPIIFCNNKLYRVVEGTADGFNCVEVYFE